jgi:hypothetical protein
MGYRPLCREIVKDNKYGKILFQLWAWILGKPVLTQAWVNVLRAEEDLLPSQKDHARVLWGMFTGSEPYRSLLRRLIRAETLLPLYRNVRKLKGRVDGPQQRA